MEKIILRTLLSVLKWCVVKVFSTRGAYFSDKFLSVPKNLLKIMRNL